MDGEIIITLQLQLHGHMILIIELLPPHLLPLLGLAAEDLHRVEQPRPVPAPGDDHEAAQHRAGRVLPPPGQPRAPPPGAGGQVQVVAGRQVPRPLAPPPAHQHPPAQRARHAAGHGARHVRQLRSAGSRDLAQPIRAHLGRAADTLHVADMAQREPAQQQQPAASLLLLPLPLLPPVGAGEDGGDAGGAAARVPGAAAGVQHARPGPGRPPAQRRGPLAVVGGGRAPRGSPAPRRAARHARAAAAALTSCQGWTLVTCRPGPARCRGCGGRSAAPPGHTSPPPRCSGTCSGTWGEGYHSGSSLC